MSSMQGADLTLVVTKNPGLEMADILDTEGSADGGSAAAWLKHLTGWGDSSTGSGAGRPLSCTVCESWEISNERWGHSGLYLQSCTLDCRHSPMQSKHS